MEVVDMDEQIYTFEDVINSEKHVEMIDGIVIIEDKTCLLYTSPSPRDA